MKSEKLETLMFMYVLLDLFLHLKCSWNISVTKYAPYLSKRVPVFLHNSIFSSRFSISKSSNYKSYRKNIINTLETKSISGVIFTTHGFKLQDLILSCKLWVLLADIQAWIKLKNIRQNHKQEISLDDAAGKSMQKREQAVTLQKIQQSQKIKAKSS